MATGDKKRVLMQTDIGTEGGVAPAGYGLGGNAKTLTSADDLNDIWQCGWYVYESNNAPLNAPDLQGTYADMVLVQVIGFGNTVFHQEAYPVSDGVIAANNPILVRSRYGNVFKGWDWVNPPMMLGVQYRTTERYLGKPVYVMAYNFGALPNATCKEGGAGIYIGDSGHLIDYWLVVSESDDAGGYEFIAPRIYPDDSGNTLYNVDFVAEARANHYIYCKCYTHQDYTAATGVGVFKYTRTED